MKILALDSSTHACSVALLDKQSNAEAVIQHHFELAARQHTQRLLPMVDQLLVDCGVSLSQIDAIAFGRGPGSFTGLRICLGAVQGLAYGADIPVIAISTLAAQAQAWLMTEGQGVKSDFLLSTLDARMSEVYWALYQLEGHQLVCVGDERLTAPEQLLAGHHVDRQNIIGLGSGYQYAVQVNQFEHYQQWHADILPTASAVAELAQYDFERGLLYPAEQALPVYLRDEVAWQKQSV
ncbi:tRNA (adenosine(37)-N6)-threonylcarbamoyltransferase complex dimerization subunit type 1 TsaB [Oceanicoccus sp. KOV_DT_Chl]|uniref:tRNA (adenosine(37)-N6)-threonylcarbamoyltransferase complex dimerization subunit type 1 TsaB n=1 Tax=Oceanicoccus sp. KOV_DT_Chl TaxID=1904639 RepID=UPI000C7B5F36|nr:tRNA (adenosine(37)-N6)-threonylcarbamoyltransferase complex dimerization subunit type 1 TsaB [Oceanicoccus sp. KOV_DT_Chl]